MFNLENQKQIVEDIQNKGFSGAIKIFSLQEIEDLNSRLADYIQSKKVADTWFSAVNVKNHKNIDVETIYDAHLESNDILAIVQNQMILKIAKSFLNGNVRIWRTTFWIKVPGARRVEWHQDTFKDEGFGSFPNINFWLALDDAEEDNCLWFVEKSHHSILDTCLFKTESYIKTLEQSPLLPTPPINGVVNKLTLKPGEGVFFDGRCLHGSPPNYSQHRRAGLVIRFIPEGYQLGQVFE